MLELDDDLVGLLDHELDGVLVTQPVRPLTVSYMCQCQLSSVELPRRPQHRPLRRHGVRAGQGRPGQDGGLEARLGKLQSCPQASTAGTDNNRIKGTLCDFHLQPPENLTSPAGVADEQENDDGMQDQAHAGRLDVVHEDVTHRSRRDRTAT